MTYPPAISGFPAINMADYDIRSLDDEIRVDALCVELLRQIYRELTLTEGLSPQQAGELCHGADYLLREFIIADRHGNLFATDAASIRQFSGHWYIVRSPEPNLSELQAILQGTAAFFAFLARMGLFAESTAKEIAAQCLDLDYCLQRINDFWAIDGDGYDTWRQACPLPPAPDPS